MWILYLVTGRRVTSRLILIWHTYWLFTCRISNKKPVVAKVSPNSLRLEREYYIMKRLYQLSDGSSFLGNYHWFQTNVGRSTWHFWVPPSSHHLWSHSSTIGIYPSTKRAHHCHLRRRRTKLPRIQSTTIGRIQHEKQYQFRKELIICQWQRYHHQQLWRQKTL